MNSALVRSARIFALLLVATLAFASQAVAAVPACVGGSSLSGWYGMLLSGSADAGGGRYLTGALRFDGACGITGTNITGGAGSQYVTTSATGTYGQNSDGTFTITLNLTGQSAAQTYIVGVSQSGTKARGIEFDNTASATIDLQSQFTSLTGGYSTASLNGAYAVACVGAGVDFNYVTFDGKGNLSGVDDYAHGASTASLPYTGTYTVNSDGTFSGALAGSFSAFTFNGVVDDGVNEIEYIYNNGTGGVEGCSGKASNSTALSGYYGLLLGGSAVGGGGQYLSGTLFFNGSGGITATNVNGGNSTNTNSTATGTYTVNSDNTVTINLTLSGQSTPQTYIVGVAQGGAEAIGVEYDGTADTTVDLQAQLEPSTLPYSTASLNGTYAVSCSGSEVDLNYVSFDGAGNLAGIDPYASTSNQGNAPYTGTYSVNSDGTFSSQLAGNYSSFSFTGVLDNWTSEIGYTYYQVGSGEVVSCLGESTYGPIGTATVAATPTFSPAPGSYGSTQTVTIADTTSGAKIYYTTNGVTPTVQSKVYSGPITVSATTTVLAIAAASGFNNSAIGGGTYFFGSSGTQTAATPTFSPAPGTYSSTQTVTLSDTTSGAVIHCTTDGSTPTATSPVCTSVTIGTTTTLQAIAVATGYNNSTIASGVYTITVVQTAATPTFSPAPGTYSSAQTVTLSDTTSGAVIHCTTDGSTPTANSPVCTSLTVSASTTINAIAVATGYNNSAIATGLYTISTTNGGTVVNLSSYYNIYGIATSGNAPKNGGFDNNGYSYNSSLLGTALTYQGLTFPLAGANALDAVIAQTVNVPQAQYSQLYLLGAAVNGAQTSQSIIAYYTDGSSSTLTQSFSDWAITPKGYTGESTVSLTASRITPTGGTQNGTIYVYGYTLALNSSKTLASVKLPFNRNVVFLGMGLAGGTPTTATPTFSPAPGTYTTAQTITLSDTTSGATIYYTTNGTQPTTSSTKYTGPFTVSATATVEAIAAAIGYNNSAVASGVYTITTTSTWTQIGTSVNSLGAASDGTLVVTNTPSQNIWEYVSGKWSQISGQAKLVVAASQNSLFGIDLFNNAWAYSGGQWKEIGTNVGVIAAGADGTVVATNNGNQSIWFYVSGKWTQISGTAKQLAVVNKNNIWSIGTDNNVYQWTGSSWTKVGGSATSIAAASDGTVVVTNSSNQIWQYVSANNWVQLPGTMKAVAAVKANVYFGIGTDNNVYSYGALSTGNLIANGTYYITSIYSGLAIDDPGFSTQNGKIMQQYTLNKGSNQQWTVTNLGNNVITLTNGSSNMVLGVSGASKSNSAQVDQETSTGAANQQWTVVAISSGVYELVNLNSGLALDVTGASKSSGTLLDQYPYQGNAWQQWAFTSK